MTNKRVYPDPISKMDTPMQRTLGDLNDQSEKNALQSITSQKEVENTCYSQFVSFKNQFYNYYNQINDTKIIEILAGIKERDFKDECFASFQKIYKSFITNIEKILSIVKLMNFENEKASSDGHYLSDIIMRDIKEMGQIFMDLITQSSLRYLRKVCEIHNFDDSEVDLQFNIEEWVEQAQHHIDKYNSKKKKNLFNDSFLSQDQNKHQNSSKKKTFFQSICPCFASKDSNNNNNKISNNSNINK